MREKEVRITKDGLEGVCMASSVAMWERNGWTRADDGSSTETPTEPERVEEDERSDPGTDGA